MDGYDVLVSVLDDASAIGRRGRLPHRGKKQFSDDGEHLHQMTPCEFQRKGLHLHFSFFGNSYLLGLTVVEPLRDRWNKEHNSRQHSGEGDRYERDTHSQLV